MLYSDADLPFDFEEVPRAIRLLRHYEIDMVSALSLRPHRRGLDAGDLHVLLQPAHPPDVRRQGARHQLRLQAAAGGASSTRVELRSEGSFIDAELIIRATRSGFELLQFGVDYFPRTRGESTLSSPGVIVKVLREMVALRGELESIQRPGGPANPPLRALRDR